MGRLVRHPAGLDRSPKPEASAGRRPWSLKVTMCNTQGDVRHGYAIVRDGSDGDPRPRTKLFTSCFCYVLEPASGLEPPTC
jgi:hypothetical protein